MYVCMRSCVYLYTCVYLILEIHIITPILAAVRDAAHDKRQRRAAQHRMEVTAGKGVRTADQHSNNTGTKYKGLVDRSRKRFRKTGRKRGLAWVCTHEQENKMVEMVTSVSGVYICVCINLRAHVRSHVCRHRRT